MAVWTMDYDVDLKYMEFDGNEIYIRKQSIIGYDVGSTCTEDDNVHYRIWCRLNMYKKMTLCTL